MKRFALFFLLLTLVCTLSTGRPAGKLSEDPRITAVHQALDASVQSGPLGDVCRKYNFHGQLEYQFAFKKGGKVLHCRNLSADTQDNLFLSRFQKELMKFKTEVKIRKGEQLKLTHKFQIP